MFDARAIAEETARASYGRLLALLAARTRDIAAAEDALADAFTAALETWPSRGVPDAPEAWLLTAARRKLIDAGRRAQTRNEAEPSLLIAVEEIAQQSETPIADERLKLLFVCAHPAIDPDIRTPLMLQTVLGLDAMRVGSAFLVAPTTMGQRLVRAKKKIAAAGIPFETPEAEELPERLSAVLDAIYAAFGAGYDSADGADPRGSGLSEEALYLGSLAAALAPEEPEAHGLLSLMLHIHARRAARRNRGEYVPFDHQNTELWDRKLIARAEMALLRAADLGKPGRYQLEAAIQSGHAAARLHGVDNAPTIVSLYEALLGLAPSTGAEVGRAAALLKAGRRKEALAALDAIDKDRASRYQPYWATRAAILAALGDDGDADAAYEKAIGLSEDSAVRDFLFKRRSALPNAPSPR
jgi:RNA polymerase sigma-70 factor (ECF subfamily)